MEDEDGLASEIFLVQIKGTVLDTYYACTCPVFCKYMPQSTERLR